MPQTDKQRLKAWLQTRLKNRKVVLLTGNSSLIREH